MGTLSLVYSTEVFYLLLFYASAVKRVARESELDIHKWRSDKTVARWTLYTIKQRPLDAVGTRIQNEV